MTKYIIFQYKLFFYQVKEDIVLLINRTLPRELRNRITLHRLGELSTTPVLWNVIVPEITVDQIIQAMKEEDKVGR